MDDLKIQQLNAMIKGIKPPDKESLNDCYRHWDSLAKPIGGFGRLEDILAQIAAIEHTADIRLDRKALVIFCADNGIAAEGVSQTGQSVTAVMAKNLGKGIASANIMAAVADVDVFPIDIGIASEIDEVGVMDFNILRGTADFLKEPAMSMDDAAEAVLTGIQSMSRLKDMGYDIVAAGEMGIGNTTTSAAVAAVMLDLPCEDVAGRGAGLSDEGLKRKIEVIREGISKHHPDRNEPLSVLAALGGLDIAGICGLMLGGAICNVPVVMDGIVSCAAALIATALAPSVKDYIIPSHMGKEPVCHLTMDALGLCPVIDASLALGEGTGAIIMLSILSMAWEVYKQGHTFTDLGIEPYQHFE